MKRDNHKPTGPSQRMLRVGELVRHALASLFARGEIEDPVLEGPGVHLLQRFRGRALAGARRPVEDDDHGGNPASPSRSTTETYTNPRAVR